MEITYSYALAGDAVDTVRGVFGFVYLFVCVMFFKLAFVCRCANKFDTCCGSG